MLSPDKNGLYHPGNEDEVAELVRLAVSKNLQLRVRGAAQSVEESVFTSGFPSTKNINIQLDRLRSVTFDNKKMQVTVGAGCNLGVDPFDPTSTIKNGLYYKLNKKGLALQNVPDAAHQTVAGFLSTGSSGSTNHHSFDECVLAIVLIDGTGTRREFKRSKNPDDPFFGVGVSMGLLGVIVSVTLQCVPAFNVIGELHTAPSTACAFDFAGPGKAGKPSLEKFFNQQEYSRLLWWPYHTVQRIITWQARTMRPSDYKPKTTGTPKNFKPKPYQPTFPSFMGTSLPARIVAAFGYKLIGTWPGWVEKLMGKAVPTQQLEQMADGLFPQLYPQLLAMFFPDSGPNNPPQKYWDNWRPAFGVDEVEFSDELFSMVYTEFWVDSKDTQRLIKTFQDHYVADGLKATWFYCVEVMAAKKSDFWMSPGYGHNSTRISINWWKTNQESAMEYYQQFWDLLRAKGIPFRLHWGKYLPPPETGDWASYLQKQYPRWKDFQALRKTMDPNNIFVTPYWKAHLGI